MTKAAIKSKIDASVKKTLAPLMQPVDKLAPVDVVENILYGHSQIMLSKAKANLSSVVNSAEMVNSLNVFKGKANYSVTIGSDFDYYKAYMLKWFEYGTKDRYRRATKKGGGSRKGGNVYTGKIVSRPFMRPAFEQTKAQVFEKIQKSIINLIEVNIKKQMK
jgi:hypothetical protein